jgi:hypothetical protein
MGHALNIGFKTILNIKHSGLLGEINLQEWRGELKNMKTNRGVFYALAVMLILLSACSSSRTGGTINDKGDQIELTAKEHVVKAFKIGPVAEDTFVLFTANPFFYPDSMKYLDGRVIVMAKKDVDKLKTQYGDFSNIENKGHAEARKSIRYMSIIAADGATQKQLKKLIELNSRKSYPLIKLSMQELKVTELIYKKSKVVLSGNVGKQYLISKISILEDNFKL